MITSNLHITSRSHPSAPYHSAFHAIAAEILAKLQTATTAIQELQEMLEEGE